MSGPPAGRRRPGETGEADDTGPSDDRADDLGAQLDASAATAHGAEERLLSYQALFDAAPDPAFITDRHGRLLHANRAALELLDHRRRAVHPWRKPLAVYVALPDRRAFRTALDRALDGPGRLRLAFGPPGGLARAADVRVVPLPGGDGILWAARLDDDVML